MQNSLAYMKKSVVRKLLELIYEKPPELLMG